MATFWKNIKAAFNARPIGMFVPPNWIALAGFALAGATQHPGFFLIGAGLELAYLLGLASSKRFQRYVEGKETLEEHRDWQKQLQHIISQLGSEERERYWRLQRRCQGIIEQQRAAAAATPAVDKSVEIAAQGEGLSRLLFIYLRLLRTRQAILRVLRESLDLERQREPLDRRLRRLERELVNEQLNDALRKSLEGQIDILAQRLEKRDETRQKLAFLDAELTRIEEQVELIREQAVISSEPHSVSTRIDEIAATMSGTQQWIKDQQSIIGTMDEMLTDPPPLVVGAERESE